MVSAANSINDVALRDRTPEPQTHRLTLTFCRSRATSSMSCVKAASYMTGPG